MITSALILTFCTFTTCEEYVIDHSLTKEDCIERMVEERKDSQNESFEQMYLDAVESYQAVAMTGEIKSATFKCTTANY
jgi:hypothetical protein